MSEILFARLDEIVSNVTGTSNQINVGILGSSFILSLSTSLSLPGSLAVPLGPTTMVGPLTITPTLGENQGLRIHQTSDGPAAFAGPYFANEIIGTWTGRLTGGGGAGGPETMHQLNIQLYTGGPDYHTQSTGAISGVIHHVANDNSPGDIVGSGGTVNITAVRSQGKGYGIAGAAIVDTGGSASAVFGQENNLYVIGTGIVTRYAIGFNSLIGSTNAAGTAEAAYAVSISGGIGIIPWKYAILVSDRDFGTGSATNIPISSTGHGIHFDYTGTLDTLLNAPNITTTNVFKTPNSVLTGAGVLQLGRGASPTADGALIFAGSAGGDFGITFQYGAVAKWLIAASATQLHIGAPGGPPAYALTIDSTTDIVTAPSGLIVANGLTATGTLTFGGFTHAQAGNVSLPAIVQGDLWYGSAAGTISALAKNAGTSRFLKNSGTTNNPAWAQPAFTDLSGSIAAAQMPAFTDDATSIAGAVALTLATVNSNVGAFGSATQTSQVTVNGKGLITAASNITITPAIGNVTGLGTGVVTALGINTGSAGALITFNGAGGTPSSLTLTNATGLPLASISQSAVANPSFVLNKAASGQDNFLVGQMAGLNHWGINLGNNNAVSGSNVGSNFDINRYSDAGSYLGTSISINRATGNITLGAQAILPSYTVAGLPAGNVGALAFVTDAVSTAITGLGLAPVGGGANKVVVYYDGAWKIL